MQSEPSPTRQRDNNYFIVNRNKPFSISAGCSHSQNPEKEYTDTDWNGRSSILSASIHSEFRARGVQFGEYRIFAKRSRKWTANGGLPPCDANHNRL